MASLVGDWPAINAYLLIHAVASASSPHIAYYPAGSWATVAGLALHAEMDSAKSRWSKQVTKLVERKLVKRSGSGRSVTYTLLHESGNGDPYTRPRTAADGPWFALPHAFWLEGHERDMDTAEKVMLLISMSLKPGFELPASRAPSWYGVSESTAKRGLRKLERDLHMMSGDDYVPDAKSRTMWRTVRSYHLIGPWGAAERKAAMRTRRSPAFQAASAAASAAAASASATAAAASTSVAVESES
ncbi:hypothetical protein SAMN05216488_2305 [Microbacterium sp. LKL04]|nr:hypothetical protein SAMN05216488_2305 [Microbacterium sp. LKL04]